MSSSHTPGPWKAINGRTADFIRTEKENKIATVDGVWCGTDVRRANALLIAAAPSLLAELKHLTEAINEGHIKVTPRFSPLYTQALAAIEQADPSSPR